MGKTVMLMSVKSFFGNSNEVVSLKQFGQPSEERYYPIQTFFPFLIISMLMRIKNAYRLNSLTACTVNSKTS